MNTIHPRMLACTHLDDDVQCCSSSSKQGLLALWLKLSVGSHLPQLLHINLLDNMHYIMSWKFKGLLSILRGPLTTQALP